MQYEQPPRYPAGYSTYILSTHENGTILTIHEDTWLELHDVPAHAIEFVGYTDCEWEPEPLYRIADRDAIRQSVSDDRLLEQALAQIQFYYEYLPIEMLANAEGCECRDWSAWARMMSDTPEGREAAYDEMHYINDGGDWDYIHHTEVTASWD